MKEPISDWKSSDWLRRHAHTKPSKVALVELDELVDLVDDQQAAGGPPASQVTYAELWGRTQARARRLERLGVGQGDRVAALLPNRVAMVTLQAACAHLGAIFAPLNLRLSAKEIGRILADAEPAVTFFDRRTETLAESAARCCVGARVWELVDADEDFRDFEFDEGSNGSAAVEPDDAALLVYTSGSTGEPRGVVLTHANLVWNHAQFLIDLPFGSDDINYCAAPMFHVAGLNVLTWPLLLAGGTSILAPSFEPQAAVAALEAHRATCAFMVPTMWRALLECDALADADLSAFKGGVVGGAACPPELIRAWAERGVVLMQGYGMTEAGPMATLLGPEHAVERAGSVGVPGAFVDVRLVDADGEDVRDGRAGQVLLRGPNVMAGYWQNPQASAETLRDGWLHSGDLGRRDPDGRYHIIGRLTDMIITGAENVHPVEVEQVLETMEGVVEAAVFGAEDPHWGEQVCCAVVVDDGGELAIEDVVAFCSRSVARYKCPRRLLQLDELPRNGAGKVLRGDLRAMVQSDSPRQAAL